MFSLYIAESLRGSAKISDQISSTKERLSEHSSSQKVRKRRNVMSGGRQVQGLSAGQGCNGIILEWNALSLPFRYNIHQYTIDLTSLISNNTDLLLVS